jgi:hypothetical protein
MIIYEQKRDIQYIRAANGTIIDMVPDTKCSAVIKSQYNDVYIKFDSYGLYDVYGGAEDMVVLGRETARYFAPFGKDIFIQSCFSAFEICDNALKFTRNIDDPLMIVFTNELNRAWEVSELLG